MKYKKNSISENELLQKLNNKFGKGDWPEMLQHNTYSLVANCKNYKDYPQYFSFKEIDGGEYIVEYRNAKLANIYEIDEIEPYEYEYSLHEILLETAHEWTDDVEKVAKEIYLID